MTIASAISSALHKFRRILPPWIFGIRGITIAAFAALFLAFSAMIGISMHRLEIRRHDYEILRITDQMSETAALMASSSKAYLAASIAGHPYDGDIFRAKIAESSADFDKSISSLQTCDFENPGDLPPPRCAWSPAFRSAIASTARDWESFRASLESRVAKEKSGSVDIAIASHYSEHGDELAASARKLSASLRQIMQQQISGILFFGKIAIAFAGLLMAVLLSVLYHRIALPLQLAIDSFRKISSGFSGLQIPVARMDEIGEISSSFNRLSSRLAASFRLSGRIQQGESLQETIAILQEEVSRFVPVEWIGLFSLSPDNSNFVLEKAVGDGPLSIHGGLPLDEASFSEAFAHGQPTPALKDSALSSTLLLHGLLSAVALPISSSRGLSFLVMACQRPNAYDNPARTAFLSTISPQISSALARSTFPETLAAVSLQGLAHMAESRDPEAENHLARISLYSSIIADELSSQDSFSSVATPDFIRQIAIFAPMHDLGNISLPDSILRKRGRLDDSEIAQMRMHPLVGAETIRRCESQANSLGVSLFKMAIEIAESHHERYNGSGYPRGIAGNSIPLSARIVAVADVFDALSSRRPYREALLPEQASEAILSQAGREFDPDVIAAFRRGLPRILAIYERLKHV